MTSEEVADVARLVRILRALLHQKQKGRFNRPFCFGGEEEDKSLCARCDRANKRYAYVASNASGVHLAQPIRSNAEDGVWVQTPLISTKPNKFELFPYDGTVRICFLL